MSFFQRRVLALVLVAALLVAASIGHLAVRTNLADSEARLERTEAVLAPFEQRNADIRAEVAEAQGMARTTGGSAAELTAEIQQLRDEAGRLHEVAASTWATAAGFGAQASEADVQLGAAQAELSARGAEGDQLRTCLDGVQLAATRSGDGDAAGAVAALQEVVDPCRGAQGLGGETGVVYPFDFPDPAIVEDGGNYFAYATNAAGGAVQLITSPDLVHWEPLPPALEAVPGWARAGAVWAPAVIRLGDTWALYYAVRQQSSQRHCLSVATASSPAGPFVDASTGPLVCDTDQGGSIDPAPYIDADGRPWLVWKSEGETIGGRAEIRAQALRNDGLAVTGRRAVLLTRTERWEGRTIEGPTMLPTASGLVLLYSANNWNSADYTIGAAICDTPLGPCHRTGAVLGSTGGIVGPGGPQVFIDASGAIRFVYHAWLESDVGYPHPRFLHVGWMVMDGTYPVLTP